MAVLLSFTSVISLLVAVCWLFASQAIGASDDGKSDLFDPESPEFGGGGSSRSAADFPHCPCVPRDQCPRLYGQSATDVRELGFLEPCIEFGTVRCCGVAVTVTSDSDSDDQSPLNVLQNSGGGGDEELEVSESKPNKVISIPIRDLLKNRRPGSSGNGPQLTFPAHTPLEPTPTPTQSTHSTDTDEPSAQPNASASPPDPEGPATTTGNTEHSEPNTDEVPMRTGARILTGSTNTGSSNVHRTYPSGIRRPAVAPSKGPSRPTSTTVKPILLLRPPSLQESAVKKKAEKAPPTTSAPKTTTPRPSPTLKEANKTLLRSPLTASKHNASVTPPKIRPFRRPGPSPVPQTENSASEVPKAVVTSMPFRVIESSTSSSNRETFNNRQRPRPLTSNRRPLDPTSMIPTTATPETTTEVTSTGRPMRRRRPFSTSTPPSETEHKILPVSVSPKPEILKVKGSESEGQNKAPVLYRQPQMTGHRKLLGPRVRSTIAPSTAQLETVQDPIDSVPLASLAEPDQSVAATTTVQVIQEPPASFSAPEHVPEHQTSYNAPDHVSEQRPSYHRAPEEQPSYSAMPEVQESTIDYNERPEYNEVSYPTVFTEPPTTTTAHPVRYLKPNRLHHSNHQPEYTRVRAPVSVVTSVPVRMISQYSRIRSKTDGTPSEQSSHTRTTASSSHSSSSSSKGYSSGRITASNTHISTTNNAPTGFSGSRRFSIPSHIFERISSSSSSSSSSSTSSSSNGVPPKRAQDDTERHSSMQQSVRNRVRDHQGGESGEDNYDLILDKEKRKYMQLSHENQPGGSFVEPARTPGESLSEPVRASPFEPKIITESASSALHELPHSASSGSIGQELPASPDLTEHDLSASSGMIEQESRIQTSIVTSDSTSSSNSHSSLENGSESGLNIDAVSPATVISTPSPSSTTRPFVRKRIRQRVRIPTTTTTTTTTTTSTTEIPKIDSTVNVYDGDDDDDEGDSESSVLPSIESENGSERQPTGNQMQEQEQQHYSVQYDKIVPSLPAGGESTGGEFRPISYPYPPSAESTEAAIPHTNVRITSQETPAPPTLQHPETPTSSYAQPSMAVQIKPETPASYAPPAPAALQQPIEQPPQQYTQAPIAVQITPEPSSTSNVPAVPPAQFTQPEIPAKNQHYYAQREPPRSSYAQPPPRYHVPSPAPPKEYTTPAPAKEYSTAAPVKQYAPAPEPARQQPSKYYAQRERIKSSYGQSEPSKPYHAPPERPKPYSREPYAPTAPPKLPYATPEPSKQYSREPPKTQYAPSEPPKSYTPSKAPEYATPEPPKAEISPAEPPKQYSREPSKPQYALSELPKPYTRGNTRISYAQQVPAGQHQQLSSVFTTTTTPASAFVFPSFKDSQERLHGESYKLETTVPPTPAPTQEARPAGEVTGDSLPWISSVESSIKERLKESTVYDNNEAQRVPVEKDQNRPTLPSLTKPNYYAVRGGDGNNKRYESPPQQPPRSTYPSSSKESAVPLAYTPKQLQNGRLSVYTTTTTTTMAPETSTPPKTMVNIRPEIQPPPLKTMVNMRGPESQAPPLKTIMNIRAPEGQTPPAVPYGQNTYQPPATQSPVQTRFRNLTSSRFRVPQKFVFPTAQPYKNSESKNQQSVTPPTPPAPPPLPTRIQFPAISQSEGGGNYGQPPPPPPVSSQIPYKHVESNYKQVSVDNNNNNYKPVDSHNYRLPYNSERPSQNQPQQQLYAHKNRYGQQTSENGASQPVRTEIKIESPPLPTRPPPQQPYRHQEKLSPYSRPAVLGGQQTFSRPSQPSYGGETIEQYSPRNRTQLPYAKNGQQYQPPALQRTIEENPKEKSYGQQHQQQQQLQPQEQKLPGTPGFSISFTSLPDQSIINHGPVPPNHYMTVSEKMKIQGGQTVPELVAVPKPVPPEATAGPSPNTVPTPSQQQAAAAPSNYYQQQQQQGQVPYVHLPKQQPEVNNYYRPSPNGLNLPPIKRPAGLNPLVTPPAVPPAPAAASSSSIPFSSRPQPNELYGDFQQRYPYQSYGGALTTTTTSTTAPSFTQSIVNRLKSSFRISRSSSEFKDEDEMLQGRSEEKAEEKADHVQSEDHQADTSSKDQGKEETPNEGQASHGSRLEKRDVEVKPAVRTSGTTKKSSGKKATVKATGFKAPRVFQRGFFPVLPYSEKDPGPKLVKSPPYPMR